MARLVYGTVSGSAARSLRSPRMLRIAALLTVALAACSAERVSPPAVAVPSASVAAPERGQLLYETACKTCHDTQTHWRSSHFVRDWPTLIEQVTRWQGIAGQTWRREDIEDVAAYLNRQFYRLPCPLPGCKPGTVG
jgi:mono/diheme cytochrome c family protein